MRSTVTLSGNVVTDVALRSTSAGPVANFRMAVTESWWDKRTERWAERVTYLQVSAWRQLAEHVADSLAKGQPVVVVGRLRRRFYQRPGVWAPGSTSRPPPSAAPATAAASTPRSAGRSRHSKRSDDVVVTAADTRRSHPRTRWCRR